MQRSFSDAIGSVNNRDTAIYREGNTAFFFEISEIFKFNLADFHRRSSPPLMP